VFQHKVNRRNLIFFNSPTAKHKDALKADLIDPCKLKSGTVGIFQDHLIARELDLINRRSKWRFDFDPMTASETISTTSVSDKDQPVFAELPYDRAWIARVAPFANN